MSDETITGNAIRDNLLYKAIIAAQENGEPISLACVAMRLPHDFDLGESELAAMVAAMNEPQPAEAEPQPEPDAAPIPSMAELQEWILALNNSLSEARGDVLSLQNELRTARERLATAIGSFQQGFAPVTREQLMREHIAAEAERKRLGEGLNMRGSSQPGPSVIDQSAFYSRGGSANRGYGPKWRRGAFGAEHRGRRIVPTQG